MAITNKVLEFTLELTPGGIPPIIHASQGDVGRTFKANVVWNGSAASAYISGTTVKLRGKKPDKTVFDYSATLSGSAVTFATTEQMTIISGPVECELVFTSGDDIVASANFILCVEDSPWNPDALSESDVDTLGELVSDQIPPAVGEWLEDNVGVAPTKTVIDNAVSDYLDENGVEVPEVVDIRTAYNGVVYPSAGDAVRGQVEELHDEINKIAKPLYFPWAKFEKPSGFPNALPFNIYYDGHNFITDFNFDNFKNTGGTTYYVTSSANGGSGSNDGLTRNTPKTFATAYNVAVNGDTLVILEGDYDRDTFGWGTTVVQKNINIVGDGKCRLFAGQLNMTFTKTSGQNYVYQTTRSAAKKVIDYKTIDGKYIHYKPLSSIAEVDAKESSYYIDGSTVYVHAIGGGDPSELVCVTVLSEKWLDVNSAAQDTKVCYQNIELIGRPDGVLFNRATVTNTLTVICDNVRGYYCGDGARDTFRVYGGMYIFNNCHADCSAKDGFNYNGTNISGTSTDCYAIEINCTGSNCGLTQSGESQNGTTAHAGAKVVRINGKYYDNFGANVADVQDGTMSLNLGCNAFYSAGTLSGANENFAAQQSGTTMWFYGCVGVGAVKDFNCVTGSTMYLDKCTYKIKAGGGSITEVNTVPYDIYTLYKLNEIK